MALSIGRFSRVKGVLGCWIVASEWDDRGEHIIDVKCAKVDGVKIKDNVYYTLMGGKFVEGEHDAKTD